MELILITGLWIIFILAALLTLIVVLRTLSFKPERARERGQYRERTDLGCAGKLAGAIRIPTLTGAEETAEGKNPFVEFHRYLEETFPRVHNTCEKIVINRYSLVYRLKAVRPAPGKKPVLITAHMDVVPVEAGTEEHWTQPAFSGAIKEGLLWGRGTLDTKAHLICAMEALEGLLEKGFAPARDIWLAFGHDEEFNGEEGALKIADYFKEQGLEFDFVLDEGGCVVKNAMDGIDKPIALVGVGEKGFANIRLSVSRDGGHASMPAPHTSLGILAEALCRLEKNPSKPRLIPSVRAFLLKLGPHMKGFNRVILANLWLFEPLFLRVFSGTNTGSALLRTTLAVTMAKGSPAPNVIPQKSSAVINCRILPGEDGKSLIKRLEKILKGLPVELEPLVLDDPSSLSPSDCEAYRYLESLIESYCGDAIIVPYLIMASTDARKYEGVCKNIYRFTPYIIDNEDVGRIHGTDENISVANINRLPDFFTALIKGV